MGSVRNRARTPTRKIKRMTGAKKIKVTPAENTQQTTPQPPNGDARPIVIPSEIGPHETLSATPLSRTRSEPQASSSSKKLGNPMNDDTTTDSDAFVMFSILGMQNIFSVIACPGCKHEGVALEEVVNKKQGLAVTFVLKCFSCLWEHEFLSSHFANVRGKTKRNNMEVNVRICMALRNLGIGYDGL